MTNRSITQNKSRAGGFQSLSSVSAIAAYLPWHDQSTSADSPKRKSLDATPDRGLFIKSLKQCFVRNPRLMPMTRIMLSLLSGWAGQGGSIETTTGIVGKHLSRCRRQVFRYLKDAEQEGYLFYSRTKNRFGLYTGIRIYLNFGAIRHQKTKQPQKSPQIPGNPDVTYQTETKDKYIYNNKKNEVLLSTLERFGRILRNTENTPLRN